MSKRFVADESATTLTRKGSVLELVPEAVTRSKADPSLFTVAYIRAGWSLNNRYYPASILKTQGVEAAVPNTQLFIDHATAEEDYQRPVGSVGKLAAFQEGAAWWDESTQSVMANVRVIRAERERLNDLKTAIGLSVRAWVLAESGEAEGRTGEIITALEGYKSVDFVTVPAAGGRIVSVSESFNGTTDEARNAGHWLEARLHMQATEMFDRMFGEGYFTKPERLTLSGALGDALQAFSSRIESDAPNLYSRDPYSDPGPIEVQAEESGNRAGQENERAVMPKENEKDGAVTATGSDAATVTAEARAAVAESERDRFAAQARITSEAQQVAAEASARAERAEAEMRRMVGENAARLEVGRQVDALSGVPSALIGLMRPRVESAVAGRVPFVTEGDNRGAVDTAALTAAVTTAIEAERTYAARILEASGVGQVSGLGGVNRKGPSLMSDDAASKELSGIFESLGAPKAVADLAGKGRN